MSIKKKSPTIRKDGKKRLQKITSKFYEAPRGIERDTKKMNLSDLGHAPKVDAIELAELHRVEHYLTDLITYDKVDSIGKIQGISLGTFEGQSMLVERAISMETELNPAQVFDIITGILQIDKNFHKFFNSLHEGAKEYFKSGL